MRLWIDGQFMQTSSKRRGIGRYLTALLGAVSSKGDVELIMSFNAAMPDSVLPAREAVEGLVARENIHVWHGVQCVGEAVGGFAPERHLNEIAISHHVNCIAPDVALSASPFEGGFDEACPLLPGSGASVPIVSIYSDLIAYRFKYMANYKNSELYTKYYIRRLEKFKDFDDNLCTSGFSENALGTIFPGINAKSISGGVLARAGAPADVVGFDELLFDPASLSQRIERIVYSLGHPEQKKIIFERAKARDTNFSWQRSADLATYRFSRLKPKSRFGDHSDMGDIASRAGKLSIDTATSAKTLALSEIPSDEPILIIDVTATTLDDLKTGIQRVVKKICGSISDGQDEQSFEIHLGFCDDENGWFGVDRDTFSIPEKTKPRLLPNRNTTLLMLDSSWEQYDLHQKFMRACRIRGGKVVSVLYDLIPINYSGFCNPGTPQVFLRWFQCALLNSTGIICISQAVADELLAWLEGVRFPRRLNVGYWQLGANFGEGIQSIVRAKGTRPRFLMVGTLEPRKGHAVALDAFERLWKSGVDIELTIVGKIGWRIDHVAQRIRAHREHGERLHWYETTNDTDLAQHYADCDALIAASYAEGFGLPIVEAGYFGKPVLASDIPVFREAAKGANSAIFFKVGQPNELAKEIYAFLSAEPKVLTLPPKWPSWAESATQLKDILLKDDWYRIYTPASTIADRRPSQAFNNTRMVQPLPDEQRLAKIDLVDGPVLSSADASWRIVISVKNDSTSIWSSRGDADGALGVNISYHILDINKNVIRESNRRTAIPFVIIPSGTIYLPVLIPLADLPDNAQYIEIKLVQEGVSWFGDPLVVPLPRK